MDTIVYQPPVIPAPATPSPDREESRNWAAFLFWREGIDLADLHLDPPFASDLETRMALLDAADETAGLIRAASR